MFALNPDVDPLPPFHLQFGVMEPEGMEVQYEALQERRQEQFEEDEYEISSPHLIAHIRDVEQFLSFLNRLGEDSTRFIRSLFFAEMTISLSSLGQIFEILDHVQLVVFNDVEFDMTSWRGVNDQTSLFGNRRVRIIDFEDCYFREEADLVLFSENGEAKRKPRIMANRMATQFYQRMVSCGRLIHLNNTSKCNENFCF